MNTFLKHLAEPLNSIREQPHQFGVWWLVAIGVGLSGLWLPMLLAWSRNKDAFALGISLINAGSLASFSVVLLAEGLAGAWVAMRTGTNVVAAGLRGLVSVVAFLVVLIQVGFLATLGTITDGSLPSPNPQLFFTAIAVSCASYLYCFRFASWEKNVDAVRKADDQTVEDLAKSAQQANADDEGVLL